MQDDLPLKNARDITKIPRFKHLSSLSGASVDQICTFPLRHPTPTHRPSVEIWAQRILLECPLYAPICEPVSDVPDSGQFHPTNSMAHAHSSGEYVTEAIELLWPVHNLQKSPVCTFHSRTVQSCDTGHYLAWCLERMRRTDRHSGCPCSNDAQDSIPPPALPSRSPPRNCCRGPYTCDRPGMQGQERNHMVMKLQVKPADDW